jgi:predicted nuclease of predicted toxin-antitoxin system
MARLYADEQFPRVVVELLRNLGHDVLTVQAAGKANQKIPDEEVLAFAISENRAVLTINRGDFIQLHNLQSNHTGIIVCTEDLNRQRLAMGINEAIIKEGILNNKLIRVNRPSK